MDKSECQLLVLLNEKKTKSCVFHIKTKWALLSFKVDISSRIPEMKFEQVFLVYKCKENRIALKKT